MNVLSQSIYNALKADSTLTGLIGTYTGVTPSKPCIFDSDPVPGDAQRPYVMWAGALHDEPFGGKVEDSTGREIHLDLKCVVDAPGNSQKLDSIAERVRTLLHKNYLTVTGYTDIIAYCIAGPLKAPSDPRLEVRVITFKWILN
jgi:hypothetical protein